MNRLVAAFIALRMAIRLRCDAVRRHRLRTGQTVMTGKCFIIRVVTDEHRGEYRLLANTRETAEQRAQCSFRHEFGVEGRIDYVEEV